MVHGFSPDARLISRIGLGLILLVLLVLPASLPGQVRAQQAVTPTPAVIIPDLFQPEATLIAPPILITKSVPTFVVTDLKVSNLRSVQLAGDTTRTTAAIAFTDQFTASINVQSPSSMLLGESRVITLEIIPEFLAQASMVRAELNALKFDSVDDGYPEKTIIVNTPVRWNWNIAPKEAGEQEFFLALSYLNDQGSSVHWQNITLKMSVSIAASPTGGATATLIDTPTLISFEITLTPSHTPTPTWTPTPTNLPEATPTDTFLRKVSDDVAENPAPYLTVLVTLLLGLLGMYFQYVRKRDKDRS
jgi:hypothetical protein